MQAKSLDRRRSVSARLEPRWLRDGTKPSRAAWLPKERIRPPLYWNGLLRGREWMAGPKRRGRGAG